jgi:hypothetical protein
MEAYIRALRRLANAEHKYEMANMMMDVGCDSVKCMTKPCHRCRNYYQWKHHGSQAVSMDTARQELDKISQSLIFSDYQCQDLETSKCQDSECNEHIEGIYVQSNNYPNSWTELHQDFGIFQKGAWFRDMFVCEVDRVIVRVKLPMYENTIYKVPGWGQISSRIPSLPHH